VSKCINVPNFAAIGQAVAEIWSFFDFLDGGRRHLGFSKSGILGVGRVKSVIMRHRAKFCGDRSSHC